MELLPEEYTRFYIVQALFKLMDSYEFDKISVSLIAEKAGVGRATFYRYFKSKEDVIIFYFERLAKDFVFNQRFYPRCREDYVLLVKQIMSLFKEQKATLKLLKKAKLDSLYLNYLNKSFAAMFTRDYQDKNPYLPYIYAGMLFNVSMKWLENDCNEDEEKLAALIVDAIYRDEKAMR